jgi:hypothetical protein
VWAKVLRYISLRLEIAKTEGSMSIEAGYFERAFSIWADKAEAKRKGAIAWAPRRSTWDLIQKVLNDDYKSASQIAVETGRNIKAVRSALADHCRQMSQRKIKSTGRYEWRLRAAGK